MSIGLKECTRNNKHPEFCRYVDDYVAVVVESILLVQQHMALQRDHDSGSCLEELL